ncbi:MAG: isoprenyl transferase, partial [Actinobacteria bacterium]|nr:isoprenyl transferase [Actinomycetota bacterium]
MKPPTPHRSSVRPPKLDPKQIPHHVAIVMDG